MQSLEKRSQIHILQVLLTQHSQMIFYTASQKPADTDSKPLQEVFSMSMKKNLFVMMSQYGELLTKVGN